MSKSVSESVSDLLTEQKQKNDLQRCFPFNNLALVKPANFPLDAIVQLCRVSFLEMFFLKQILKVA